MIRSVVVEHFQILIRHFLERRRNATPEENRIVEASRIVG